jgi:hypothetical protein
MVLICLAWTQASKADRSCRCSGASKSRQTPKVSRLTAHDVFQYGLKTAGFGVFVAKVYVCGIDREDDLSGLLTFIGGGGGRSGIIACRLYNYRL